MVQRNKNTITKRERGRLVVAQDKKIFLMTTFSRENARIWFNFQTIFWLLIFYLKSQPASNQIRKFRVFICLVCGSNFQKFARWLKKTLEPSSCRLQSASIFTCDATSLRLF
uniref:Uncharacterized protein n=1 Tax=Cacopsylla melanoneura TaxID=428564 RepID=A0A8D8Y948_9HEMI